MCGGGRELGTGVCGLGDRGGETGGKRVWSARKSNLRGGKASLAKAREAPECPSWRPRSLEGCSAGESSVSAPAGCASFRVGRGAVQGGPPHPPGAARRGLVQRHVARWAAARRGGGLGGPLAKGGAEGL